MTGDGTFSLGVVILAAGHSSRMGRPKLLLPWGETSVLGHLIGQWTGFGASQIAVVRQERDTVIQAELDRLQFSRVDRISNPDPDRGMFSSIQCAATWGGWQKELTHWAIVLGDQPHLFAATLRTLLDFAQRHGDDICQPSRGGHARHPVILPARIFKELAHAKAGNLKEFLAQSGKVRLIECDDAALDLDIDLPEDYEKAKRLFPPK